MAKKRTIELTVGDYTFCLKNLKIHEDMSDETTCFSADLYCNGKKIAYCKNDGRGGSTDVCYYGCDPYYELAVEAFGAVRGIRDTEYERELDEHSRQYPWYDPSKTYTQFFTDEHIAERLMNKQADWDDAVKQLKKFAKTHPGGRVFFNGKTMMWTPPHGRPSENDGGYEDVTQWVR